MIVAWFQIMVVLCFYQYSHLVYNRTYIYPTWSIVCGWSMPLAALSCIPLLAIVQIVQAEGSIMEVGSFNLYNILLKEYIQIVSPSSLLPSLCVVVVCCLFGTC